MSVGRFTTVAKGAHDVLLAGVLVGLAFPIKTTNYIILAYVLVWFSAGYIRNLFAGIKHNYRGLLLSVAPFLYCVFSLLYTQDLHAGGKAIEKFLFLALFPLLFVSLPESKRSLSLKAFAIVILTMAVVCIVNGLYNLLPGHELPAIIVDNYNGVPSRWNVITNTSLVLPFDISPIYLSMYVSFAIVIFVYGKTIFPKVLRRTAIIFLVLFLLLLGSRIGLAAALATVGCIFFIDTSRKMKYAMGAGILISVVMLVGLIGFNPVLRKRYVSDVASLTYPKDVSGWNAINIRFSIWECSLEAFYKSPVIGYGVGSQYQERQQCYKQFSWYGPFGIDFNSHNQYFDYVLIGGILLLILFFVQVGYSAKIALQHQDQIHLILLVIICTTCFGESILETNKGIVFFAFFNSIFLFNTPPTPRDAAEMLPPGENH